MIDWVIAQRIATFVAGTGAHPPADAPDVDLAAPLDAAPSSPVVAARSADVLQELEKVPA